MKTIISFSFKKLLINKGAWTVLILWCIMTLFATHQRSSLIQKTTVAADSSARYESEREQTYYKLLDSASRQLKQFDRYETDPRNPNYFNRQLPRFAFFTPGPLNLFITGQSDLFPQQYVISARPDFRFQKEEAVNGLQLLYGKLDVAFMLVLLLPLIIIAFNYNILSSEKENGTLKLILIQNINLVQLATAKMIASFVFCFLLLVIPVAGLWIAGYNPLKIPFAIGLYLLLGLLYSLFWHLLCILFNTRLRSSAYNATALMACWLVLILVYPAAVNIAAEIFHPVPSRTKFITAYRNEIVQAEKKQDNEILNRYFFDHPELVKQDTTENRRNRANEFWKEYHISHTQTDKRLQPLYDAHDRSLKSANGFAGKAGLLSPAVSMQQSLLLLGGQSSENYQYFSKEITQWRKPYLDFVLAKLVQDKDINKEEALQWKGFNYTPPGYVKQVFLHALVMLLINTCLVVLVLFYNRKSHII